MCLKKGDIVKTNYNTGPFKIIEIRGPFTNPNFVDQINGRNIPSLPYYSFVCCNADNPRDNGYYLNGFHNVNGRILSVWNDDEVFVLNRTVELDICPVQYVQPNVSQMKLFN